MGGPEVLSILNSFLLGKFTLANIFLSVSLLGRGIVVNNVVAVFELGSAGFLRTFCLNLLAIRGLRG